MTLRVPLPGDNWADLKTADELTGADQDDLYEWIMTRDAGPQDDPAGERLRNFRFGAELRDRVLGLVVTGWSYPPETHPLPYTRDTRKILPLPTCEALVRAAEPVHSLLTGSTGPDPKAQTEDSGTSPGTSPGSAAAPLPEFPDGP